MSKTTGSLLVLLALVATSCARQDDPSLPVPGSATTPTASTPLSTEPESCQKVTGGQDALVYLDGVETSGAEATDSIVFQFSKSDGEESEIPRYEIEEIVPPLTKDPGDEPMQVEGKRFFRIIFHGATGVELRGEELVQRYRGPKKIQEDLKILKEAEQQGDFEARLSWVIGLSQRRCPEVAELYNPMRVALDFAH